MPIHQTGTRQNPDGSTVVQMAERHEQLESMADQIETLMQKIGQVDQPLDVLNPLVRNKFIGYCEQMRIIAQELRTQPDMGVLSNRIYGKLKDLSVAGAFRDKGVVPAFVYNEVYQILNDKYAFLDDVQREEILKMASEILSNGNGEHVIPYPTARGQMSKESIEAMLDTCGLEWDEICKRLKFDPKTGEPVYVRRGGVMSNEQNDALFAKFPLLLENVRGTFNEGRGWYSLIDRTFENLEAFRKTVAPNLRIADVKEKFGRLHIYVSGGHPDAAMGIQKVLSEVMDVSGGVCERCGDTDGVTIEPHTGNWYKALCSNCSGYVKSNPGERMIPVEGMSETDYAKRGGEMNRKRGF